MEAKGFRNGGYYTNLFNENTRIEIAAYEVNLETEEATLGNKECDEFRKRIIAIEKYCLSLYRQIPEDKEADSAVILPRISFNKRRKKTKHETFMLTDIFQSVEVSAQFINYDVDVLVNHLGDALSRHVVVDAEGLKAVEETEIRTEKFLDEFAQQLMESGCVKWVRS